MATKLISILLSAGHLLILRNNCILKHCAHWNCFPSVANLLLLFSGEIGKCTEIRFQEVFHFPDNSHGSLRNCCVLHFSLHWSKLHSFTSKSHSTILFFVCVATMLFIRLEEKKPGIFISRKIHWWMALYCRHKQSKDGTTKALWKVCMEEIRLFLRHDKSNKLHCVTNCSIPFYNGSK